MTDRAFTPNWIVPPSESLRDVLEAKGLTVAAAADVTGAEVHQLEQVLANHAPISRSLARKLAVLGPSAGFWTNLEANYQRDRARLSRS